MAQAYQHINRMGDVYLLQSKPGKDGKPRYSFTRKITGTPVEHLPEGYEHREHPESGQVTLRKIQPSAIRPGEKLLLEQAIRKHTEGILFIVDVEKRSLVVYTAEADFDVRIGALRFFAPVDHATAQSMKARMIANAHYQKMMRFTLVDAEQRRFDIERWCFMGSIDDWHFIEGNASLPELARKYVKHLGKESFFELV